MTLSDLAAIIAGLVAGLLSGAIGIGGGLVFVPMLTIGFRVTQTVAQGTSLAAIVPTALVGGITHLRPRVEDVGDHRILWRQDRTSVVNESLKLDDLRHEIQVDANAIGTNYGFNLQNDACVTCGEVSRSSRCHRR